MNTATKQDKFLEDLDVKSILGEDVEARRNFIEKNALRVRNLDI